MAEKPARVSPNGDVGLEAVDLERERDRAGHAVERELAVDDEAVAVAPDAGRR